MNNIFRFFDLCIAFIGLIISAPVVLVCLFVGTVEFGRPIFAQRRVGIGQKSFNLYKLRSMPVGTAEVPTHFADTRSLSFYGRFIRASKLDEIPQLINVLKGEMSLVGPRPCLPSQEELINERQRHLVFDVLPGITGLAQIENIDMSTPVKLAEKDAQMISSFSLNTYLLIMLKTFIK